MQKVCVQGLGFVGAAISVALSSVKDSYGNPFFDVTGIDLDNDVGNKRIDSINRGIFPFSTNDDQLQKSLVESIKNKNLKAVSNSSSYVDAEIIVVSIPFNLDGIEGEKRKFLWDDFKNSIRQFAQVMDPKCLVVVETTVPPGTCRNVVLPILEAEFRKRNITQSPLLAHSYERVMPGADYLLSIKEFYRCYAGINLESSNRCERFLKLLINTQKYPLTRLSSLESSEIAKVLENSYRAVNIAFIEEWADFSEELGVDLHEVINAIRMRPTHSNIRQPGFGVGGYCLTKDPLFAQQAAHEVYNFSHITFPFCEMAVKTNKNMPNRCFKRFKETMGDLKNKKLLILGVSYKSDVGDTRFSPTESFFNEALSHQMKVVCHDPMVEYWTEKEMAIETTLDKIDFNQFDAIVFAVPHKEYQNLDFSQTSLNKDILIFDGCYVLNQTSLNYLRKNGNPIFITGKGRL